MNERDLLGALREQPLPAVPPALSARIRGAARERLAPRRPVRRSGALAAAAVVLLCVSHVAWTVAFLEHVQVKTANSAVLR